MIAASRNSSPLIGRNTRSGSNSTVSRSISISVIGPCLICRTVLMPTRLVTSIGTHAIR